ncbi:hypothetical protein SALBM311S_12525 [Streptomyces alboniger]
MGGRIARPSPRGNEPRGCYGIRRYLTILRPTLTAWTVAENRCPIGLPDPTVFPVGSGVRQVLAGSSASTNPDPSVPTSTIPAQPSTSHARS